MPTGQVYKDGVPQAILASPGIDGVVTTIPAAAALTNWPATFPFTITIDGGTSTMELIDVGGISGQNFTGCVRGVSGTTAQAHAAGATMTHVGCARDLKEARAHIDASSSNDSQGHSVHGLAVGAAVMGTNPQTNASMTMAAGSQITLANNIVNPIAGATQQSYNPNFTATGFSLGTGSQSGSYFQYGKQVFFEVALSIGTTTNLGTTALQFSLPKTPVIIPEFHGTFTQNAQDWELVADRLTVGTTLNVEYKPAAAALAFVTNIAPGGQAAGDSIVFHGTYLATT